MDNQQIEYYNQLSKDLKILSTPFKDNMTHEEWLYISELIDVNEFGVAFEGICDLISEKKIDLNENQKEQIKALASSMKIEDRFWKHLV